MHKRLTYVNETNFLVKFNSTEMIYGLFWVFEVTRVDR